MVRERLLRVTHLSERRVGRGFILKWFLLAPMAVVFSISIFASWFTSGWYQNVLLSLGFLCLGVLITVFYVDWLIEASEKRQWAAPRAIAAIRLRRAAAKYLRSVENVVRIDPYQSRFFVPAWHDRTDPLDSLRELYYRDDWLSYLRREVIPGAKKLESVSEPADIEALIRGLSAYHLQLLDTLNLAQGHMSPTQIENASSILDDLTVQKWYLEIRLNGNLTFLGPLFENILTRSLSLIEESNRNPDAYLPTVAEQQPLSSTPAETEV